MGLHYTESGKGETTLVFLHYFGGACNTWDKVISYLKNEYRCIAIDLPGFGKSHILQSEISVSDSSYAVAQLIEDLNLSNYILIGHSMGGKIALDTASARQRGLLSLILIAPSPATPEPMTSDEREIMNTAFGNKKSIVKLIQNVISATLLAEDLEREVENNLLVSSAGWHSWPMIGSKEDISVKMENVHVPISIICGGDDKKFTKKYLTKEFGNYFSSFSISEIEKTGHLLPVEMPEKLATQIRHFASY